jgi:hypothetical protein
VRGDHRLAFLEERRPGCAVAELRRLVELRPVAGGADLLIDFFTCGGTGGTGKASGKQHDEKSRSHFIP